jgi:replicative DNA helicase
MELVTLPQSRELEKSILGAILMDKRTLPLVVGHLKTEVFYDLGHQKIFDIVKKMYDDGVYVDITTLNQKLKDDEAYKELGGAFYLSKLTDNVTGAQNVNSHIEMLIEVYKKREAFMLFKQSEYECLDNDSQAIDLLSAVNSKLIALQEYGNIHEKTITDVILSLNYSRDKAQSGELLGYDTGFNELNNTLAGWCRPDFVVIAARPGMGKTAFMLSSIYHLCISNKIPTAIFSLEMSSEQLVERLESITSEIPLKRLRMNNLNDAERKILLKTDDKILLSPLHIEDMGGISISQLRAKATIMKQKYGIKVIFIDYLQLMSGQGKNNQNREQEVSLISRSLKSLAKELQVPIIALSQLSRRVEERGDKMPQLSDLRESGSIEQDADAVIMLMRPNYYEMTNPIEIGGTEYATNDLVICKVEKNRHGTTKNLPLRFLPETMTFIDYSNG